MSGANVHDIEIFRSLKAALVKFRQSADSVLLNGDSQMARMVSWLENEQISYWNGQIRRRREIVSRALEAVRSKKLFKDASGRTPDASREEKLLKLAQAALDDAEARLAATRRALPRLQKEIETYRGGVHGLGNALMADIPRAIAAVERMSRSLEEYVSAEAGGVQGDGFSLPAVEPGPETQQRQPDPPDGSEGDDVSA